MSSTKFLFFGPILKARWLSLPLIGWEIFEFFSETANRRNSTNFNRKQDLNVLCRVWVFSSRSEKQDRRPASDWHFRLLPWNRWIELNETWQEARSQRPVPSLCLSGRSEKKNKMAALASDWLRHFRLLLYNTWTEFNETWQEARSQRPLPSLCFSGRSEKQDSRPGLWLAETFSTSLKLLNRIQRILIGSKISTSSTKFVFWADRKNKMAALASNWPRHFRLLWNRWTEFNEIWQEARSQRPLPSLCFWADRNKKKQDGRIGL